MPIVALLTHPFGLPHAETLGLPAWVQWLAVAAVVGAAAWLVLDGRGADGDAAIAPSTGRGGRDEAPDEDADEPLVVGRAARGAPPRGVDRLDQGDRLDRLARTPVARAPAPVAPASTGDLDAARADDRQADVVRIEVAPGARRWLPKLTGQVVYVETGTPDLEADGGGLRVHRASVPHLGGAPVVSEVEAGRSVRLAAGDLAVVADGARVAVRDTTDRPASLLVLRTTAADRLSWLNPLRLLTLLLGVGAGVLALDRARAVEALASFISTGGGLNASRAGFAFAALLLVGGALAPTAPRASALTFFAAGGVGAFLATASRWQNRLEWWGAAYVLTAWEGLAYWAAGAGGLALLALAGWVYRPRRRFALPGAGGLTREIRRRGPRRRYRAEGG